MPRGFTPVASSSTAPKGFTPVADTQAAPTATDGAAPVGGLRGAGSASVASKFPSLDKIESLATTPLAKVSNQPSEMERMAESSIAKGNPKTAALESFGGGVGRSVANMASSLTSPAGIAIAGLTGGSGTPAKAALAALTSYFGARGAIQAGTPKRSGESLPDEMERRLGGAAATGAMLPGATAGGAQVVQDIRTASQIKESILASSHDWLDKSANGAKRITADARQAIAAHEGNLKQGLVTADNASLPGRVPNASVNISDLLPLIDKATGAISRAFKGTIERPLPQFDKAAKMMELAAGKSPYIGLGDLLDLRTELGKAWHRASDAQDAAAVSQLRDALTEKAKYRAQELGQTKQFDSYNKVWKNLQQYEDKGVLGKLQNATTGKDYFDLINDAKFGPQLRQLNKDLTEQAGVDQQGKQIFPNDYFKKLAADHREIYNFTNKPATTGFRGVLSAAMRRPVSGISGGVAGAAVGNLSGLPMGHYLGATGGASGAIALADRLAAIRNMSELGGVADVSGKMGPRVEPDFGGGLSGQVIQELQKGPYDKGGNYGPNDQLTKKMMREEGLVSSPEEIQKMQQEDKAEQVREAQKNKPVGEATRLANERIGTKVSAMESDIQAQKDQASALQEFLKLSPKEQLDRIIKAQKIAESKR